ncbi:hypothetical protein BV22DRAFT_845796 [Leucogyrophana mollusca]|uniref:Uncharacterized protein n=1 Tax=Leucogyrophana mollusca TaxID=85980 RepID=A0ACB8B237_9AGAM|nr:hypothetical protein BV22DRAFT_845796 [Leucogyrophana mollusca]
MQMTDIGSSITWKQKYSGPRPSTSCDSARWLLSYLDWVRSDSAHNYAAWPCNPSSDDHKSAVQGSIAPSRIRNTPVFQCGRSMRNSSAGISTPGVHPADVKSFDLSHTFYVCTQDAGGNVIGGFPFKCSILEDYQRDLCTSTTTN